MASKKNKGKKNNQSSQLSRQTPTQRTTGNSSSGTSNPQPKTSQTSITTPSSSSSIKPEEISLTAHAHIQKYLQKTKKTDMDKEEVNAVLRLSQHLRLFGLMSAVGYVNQENAQKGKVRDRTVPVWASLLGQMLGKEIDHTSPQERRELMEVVVNMARNQSKKYMASWRQSMTLAQHWNFWAKAYEKEEKKNV